MPLEPAAVGWESPSRETSWRSADCLLYALGVGAGPADLAYVTENSIGVEHRALPTMPVVLAGGMAGRFASPVLPGDELVVRIWEVDGGAAFQTLRADESVVFDAGRFTFS